MKYFILTLFLLLLTACGDGSDKKKIVIEPPPKVESTPLKGQLVDGYPTVNGGYGYNVKPGDVIAWHINGLSTVEGYVTITDALNTEVARFDTKIAPQQIKNEQPWVEGLGYDVTFEYKIPDEMRSGVYFINGNRDFMFTVAPSSSPEILVVIPTNTMNSYSCAGGRSLYSCKDESGVSHKGVAELTFKRPIRNSDSWIGDVLGLMEGYLQWSETYVNKTYSNVGYITDKELDDEQLLMSTKLIVIPGHNEYWTMKAVQNLENHLDKGNHAIVAGGNIMWWHSRYNEHGNLVSYKSKKDIEAKEGMETTYFHQIGKPAHSVMGGSFIYGGYHDKDRWNKAIKKPMRVIEPASPIFANTQLGLCSELDLSHNHELDGVPLLGFDALGYPVPDYQKISHHRVQILAYAWAYRVGYTLGTIHASQRKPDSGYVIQFGSNGAAGIGFENESKEVFKQVFANAIETLLENRSPFSANYQAKEVVTPYQTPSKEDSKFSGAICG